MKKNIEKEDRKITERVSKIILDAYKQKASDIHFEAEQRDLHIRFRIDGILKVIKKYPLKDHPALIDKIKDWSKMDLKERLLPQDGRIMLKIEGNPIDLRVSTLPTIHGENIVLRLLDHKSLVLDINKLFFSDEQKKKIKKWTVNKPYGTIVFTGPTGSGKTTTLYCLLNELNKPEVKICTVEDPVEYTLEGIEQTRLIPKKGLTFPASLRSILRHDPDIIMVGEIRDLVTAQLVVQASLTGHLVLTSLHTENATDAVIRMRDIGLEPFLISDSTNGIIAQRLVRALCKNCREEYRPDEKTVKVLKLKKKQKYYRHKGCSKCHQIGYRGRIAIYEMFEFNKKTEDLLMSGCSKEELRQQAISDGMLTLWQDGMAKVEAGLTSLNEITRVIGKAEF